MQTSLRYLPTLKRDQLNTIKQIIIKVIRPNKIILFGLYAERNSILDFDSLPPIAQAYDLLVIVDDKDSRPDYEIQDRIEQNCIRCAATTAFVHNVVYVNERLTAGAYFFYEIEQKGILLYDASKIPLVKATPPNLVYVKKTAERDFEQWGRQAHAFYATALFNRQQDYKRVCTFLLHQATEQMYQAIILTYTGYKPTTHNIDKLRRYTVRLSLELASIFPKDTQEDGRLFKLLASAYIEARYKQDFDIADDDLHILIERVGRLMSIGDHLCQNRLAYLDKLILQG